jgi:hypothetical protein
MNLSRSPPHLLTCSGPLLSHSICTALGPLLSLSRSPSVAAPTTTPCVAQVATPTTTPRRAPPRLHSDYHPTPGRPQRQQGGAAVGSAREAPHPPRSPPRSSSRPPAPGAHATTYFSSTSPWATSLSRSSPPCPPLAHGHGDVVSIERQHDSSSVHAIVAREAAWLGRPRPQPSRR